MLEVIHNQALHFVAPFQLQIWPTRSVSLSPLSSCHQWRCKFNDSVCQNNQLLLRRSRLRAFSGAVNLEDESTTPIQRIQYIDDEIEISDEEASGDVGRTLNSDDLKALLADSERTRLLRKLSEANQYNRYLKRQLRVSEDSLFRFKSELALLEIELETLVGLAKEIADTDPGSGTRKINGKYIQSHFLWRLESVHDKVKEQLKEIESLEVKEVFLFWVGMAESVQVLGSFDGWSIGEELSPEYSGDFPRFSATLKLRAGRYEIKFLVDGEWRLSPELPTTGEGMLKNNLLIVE